MLHRWSWLDSMMVAFVKRAEIARSIVIVMVILTVTCFPSCVALKWGAC